MRLNSIVELLKKQGHKVKYTKRSDGGLIITEIDGSKYKGKKGNAEARRLTGTSLSEAQIKQLKYISSVRFKKGYNPLPKDIKSEYLRIRKKWNKAFRAKDGKPNPVGYLNWRRISKKLHEEGPEAALSALSEAERYASGVAYSKNVMILAQFVASAAGDFDDPDLAKLSEDIILNASNIKEENIYQAYEELYKLNKGIEPKTIVYNVRKILKLPLE